MERSNIIKRIYSKTTSINDFKWDSLYAPPLLSFVTPEDIMYLSKLASSIKYSSKIDYKYAEIDRILKARGFVKLSAGTNRVCYRYLENDSIVLKIAIDDVGKKDNPREFKNQFYLKPYVTKIFEVSPCGVMALVERVDNLKSREEFISIAGDIFDVISNWIIGKYVLEDIGTKYFLNWGVRHGFGPVLLDFPYMYELDGEKLTCNLPISNTGEICDGLIDYDAGYNTLVCLKCHTEYKAIELKKALEENKIIGQGKVGSKMKISIKVDGKEKIIDNSKVAKKITKLERIHESKPPIGSQLVVKDPLARDINIPDEVVKSINNNSNQSKSNNHPVEKKVYNISFGSAVKEQPMVVDPKEIKEEDNLIIGTFDPDVDVEEEKDEEMDEEMDEEIIDAIIKAAEDEEIDEEASEEYEEESDIEIINNVTPKVVEPYVEPIEEIENEEEESIQEDTNKSGEDVEESGSYDDEIDEYSEDTTESTSSTTESTEISISTSGSTYNKQSSDIETSLDDEDLDQEEYQLPTGVLPPTQSTGLKVKERSAKFNADFYEKK